MKNKKIVAMAAAGTAVILILCGTLAAKTVFAAERVEVTSENSGTVLNVLAGVEVKNVYKNAVYGDTGCTVILPAGYVPSEKIKGMYQAERHPMDSSNVYYTVSEDIDADALEKLIDTDEYKNKMDRKFKETYGEGAAISSYEKEKTTVDGCPAYKIELSCDFADMKMEQLTYVIMADKIYTITYSQSADDERMEEFKKSAETIRLVLGE